MGSETSKVAESLVKAQDRIAELEANERKLREAVKVLAEVAVVLKDVQDGDELWFGDFTVSRVAKAMANPIAAEAVREAGR